MPQGPKRVHRHPYTAPVSYMPPHAPQYGHPSLASFITAMPETQAFQQPHNPTLPFLAAHHVPTATASHPAYTRPSHQFMPTMSDASAVFHNPNVYADASSINGRRCTELSQMINMEGVRAPHGGGGHMPIAAMGMLTTQQLQVILQGAHEQALRAVEPMVKKCEDYLAGIEGKVAMLEALGKRMEATLSDHEQRRDERQRAGADRQVSEEESENVHGSAGAGSQDDEGKKMTLVDRKGRGNGGFTPYGKAEHNRSKNGGVTTATSESNMGNGLLTSPPVSGEVHAATTTAATETTLGSVGASQDKKRRRHEAMDELADGGADVAHVNREA